MSEKPQGPREWWVSDSAIEDGALFESDSCPFHPAFHPFKVIEKSYADQLHAELMAAKDALEFYDSYFKGKIKFLDKGKRASEVLTRIDKFLQEGK